MILTVTVKVRNERGIQILKLYSEIFRLYSLKGHLNCRQVVNNITCALHTAINLMRMYFKYWIIERSCQFDLHFSTELMCCCCSFDDDWVVQQLLEYGSSTMLPPSLTDLKNSNLNLIKEISWC